MKELTELKNEFYEVMYKYEKSFSEEGVMANLTAWQTAKADLLSLLRRHPNWNEDEQAIIFDCNQALSIHPDMVDETAFTLLDICRSSSIADESPVFALMNSSMKSFTFTTSHSVSQARDRAMIGHGRSSIGDTERQRNLRKTHLSKDFRQKYVTLSLA